MRSKQFRTNAAEKALKQAIAEETAALQAVIRQRDAEIRQLHSVLSQVGRIVGGVVKPEAAPLPRVVPPPPQEEEQEPEGQIVDLAPGDNMGEGRWS